MNFEKELQKAVSTGKVIFGKKQSLKSMKNRKAKLVIIANNCPLKERLSDLKEFELNVYRFRGDSKKLGSICKKPFSISVVSILEEGESKILKVK